MHRLRDLDRMQAVVAAVLVALLLVPFGVSLWRAYDVGWLPSGDDALIGLRSLDAPTSNRTLIGQPSTSHLYADDVDAHHPGPIEFFWLAAPVRLLGPSAGMILGIAVVNVASVLVGLWVVLRRAGPGVAAWAAVLAGGVLWSEGTSVLSDPISSSAGSIALLALAAVAWAVFDGDVRLLPLGAVLAAWVLQQHLAIVVPAAALIAFAVVGLAGRGVARRRGGASRSDVDSSRTDGASPEADDVVGFPRWWPWVAAAVGTSLVLWSPVLWQQVTGDPGNLTAIVEYARTSESPSLGWGRGGRQVIRALGWPPMVVRSDIAGNQLYDGPLSWLEVLASVASSVVLAALVVVARRRRPALASLAALVLVLAAAGVYTGSSVPDSVEAFRANFYRWTFVVSWLGLTALGWAGALAARRLAMCLAMRRGVASGARFVAVPRWAPVLAVGLLLVPTVATLSTWGFDDERRDQNGFAAMRTVSDAAIARAREVDATRVTIVARGRSAVLASTAAVAMQLEAAGFDVLVPSDFEGRFWGDQRMLGEGDDPGLVLLLATAWGPVPEPEGRLLAHAELNPDAHEVLDRIIAQVEGVDVVRSDDAETLLAARVADEGDRTFVRDALGKLSTSPAAVLTFDVALDLLIDGYVAQPSLELDELRALRRLLPIMRVNDDDTFELREIDREVLGELVPSWSGS